MSITEPATDSHGDQHRTVKRLAWNVPRPLHGSFFQFRLVIKNQIELVS
jgi:hypothetical protein